MTISYIVQKSYGIAKKKYLERAGKNETFS